MSEPTRLRDRPELPNTLHEALRSLEEQVPAEKTVARIQQQLEALPRSPAPLPHIGAKLVLKLTALATGATIGLSAVWMWQHERTAPSVHAPVAVGETPDHLRERPDEASEVATAGAPARPVQPMPAEDRTADLMELLTKPLARATTRSARPVHASPARPTTHAARRGENAASNRPQTDTGRGAAAATELSEPSAGSAAPLASEESKQRALAPQRELVTRPDAEPTAEERSAARPADQEGADSEASVLYRAKRLEVRDPAAALSLLEGHARDFPNGAFVEERYALSIRILERLGRTERAAQLRRAFQVRFPGSVYQTTLAP